MDGTFYLGNRLLPGALEFIRNITQRGQDYVFLTNNSSRSRYEYVQKMMDLGLRVNPERIFTSGEASARYLRVHSPDASVFVVGTPTLEVEFKEYGFHISESEPDWVILGFDTTLTYRKLWKLCNLIREGVPFLATHPDINCPAPGGDMPDIGATIAYVYASTGRKPDVIVGKPNQLMIEMLSEKTGYPQHAMTMVGDRLYTDIALGTTTKVKTVLVLSGETRQEDISASPYKPDFIFADLADFNSQLS